MTPETLLETLRLHGKSSVCLVEPRDAREWAEVVAALLAVQRYTPSDSPTPQAVAVDATLDLAARFVELEQQSAATRGELDKAVAWLDRSASWRNATIDLAKGPLEAQVVELEAEVARLTGTLAALGSDDSEALYAEHGRLASAEFQPDGKPDPTALAAVRRCLDLRDEVERLKIGLDALVLARRDALAFESVPQELTQLREEVARLKMPGFKSQSVTQQVDTLNQGDNDAE